VRFLALFAARPLNLSFEIASRYLIGFPLHKKLFPRFWKWRVEKSRRSAIRVIVRVGCRLVEVSKG
jgi:hypothetical protein